MHVQEDSGARKAKAGAGGDPYKVTERREALSSTKRNRRSIDLRRWRRTLTQAERQSWRCIVRWRYDGKRSRCRSLTAPIFLILILPSSPAAQNPTSRPCIHFDVSNGKIRNLIIRIFSLGESLPFGSAVQKSMTGPVIILNGRNIQNIYPWGSFATCATMLCTPLKKVHTPTHSP